MQNRGTNKKSENSNCSTTEEAIGQTKAHTKRISYRMAGNFGGKIFWRITEKNVIWWNLLWRLARLSHNEIHSKMANRTRCEFNRAVSYIVSAELGRNRWLNATEILKNRCYAYSELFSSRRSLQWPCTRRLDRLPRVDRQATSILRCTKLFGEAMSPYAAFNGKLHADD